MGKKKSKIKVVFDSNVLISALLFKKKTSQLLNFWKKDKIIPVFSKETFEEFRKTLEYPKFSLTNNEINLIIYQEVIPFFEVIKDTEKIRGVCRDASDDKFLSCAVSANADFIVTGDKDLLDLKSYKKIPILKPGEFSDLLRNK